MTERVALPLVRGFVDGAECEDCPFSDCGRPSKPVVGEGPENPAWIIVGEGPGAWETRMGRPFIGPTGQEVNKILAQIGRPRDEVWITNATLCVEGTTQVRLADGSAERIDSLVRRRYAGYVQTVDAAGSLTTARVVDWYRNARGAREMRDVSFRWAQAAGARGRTRAALTEDHPVLTPEGWRSAADVSGGLIATGDRAPQGTALQIALGTLLGDGTLARGSLVVKHAVDQQEYAFLKARALSAFGLGTIFQVPRANAQAQVGFRTAAGAWGHATRALFYDGKQKRIPQMVLDGASLLLFTVWYLDDGSMNHRENRRPRAEICGVGFVEEDLCAASAALRRLGFETTVRAGRIHFGVEATAAFSRAIAPFVPPSMQYKLRSEDRGRFDERVYAPIAPAPFFDVAESTLKSPRRKGEGSVVYCLEVEGTHNFITPGAVVHNCQPTPNSTDQDRQRAATACSKRLQGELGTMPGLSILTLGAVAARALIPREVLDAIDPPDTAKVVKKAQKLRQLPQLKHEIARRKAVEKETQRKLKKMLAWRRKQIIVEVKVRHKQRPDEAYIRREIARDHAKMALKAREDAIKAVEAKGKERVLRAQIKAAKGPTKKAKAKNIKITDIVGTLFDVDVDGTGERPLIPGIHPAALLRASGASIAGSHTPDMAIVNLRYDFKKVDDLARGKDIRLKLNAEIEIRDPTRAAELFMRVYRSAVVEGAFSLDLETYVDDPDRHHALMAYVARIRVIGLATSELTVSLAWELLPSWAMSMLQVMLGELESTFHNGLYDRTVLRAHGFVMGVKWFDTLLAHHASFPGNSHRLQIVGSQFFGVKPWKSEYRNQDETPEGLAIYNAQDTGVTHALRGPLIHGVKKTKTEGVARIDRAMSDVASAMHLAGMPVDREVNQDLLQTFNKNVKESRQHVEEIARDPKLREQIWHYLSHAQAFKERKTDPKGPDAFEERYNLRLAVMRDDPDWKWKIGASKHIAALLQAMGVPLTIRTESGEISTKKDILESLVDVPIVREILAYRENDKLLSTFVWQIFDRVGPDGNIICYGYADENDRIHPIWNVHRISGRWSSQWPVVSNVPKDKWKKMLEAEITALGQATLDELMKLKGKSMKLIDGRVIKPGKNNSIFRMTRPNLRAQIRAPKGRKFVGFDFAQLEAKGIALVSGDEFLMSCFELDPTTGKAKKDIHIECAQLIFGRFDLANPDRILFPEDLDGMQKQLREQTKPLEYGAFYGGSVETLWKQLLKEGHIYKLADVAAAVAKLMKGMPGVVRWQKEAVLAAMRPPHEIRDVIEGRRRTWPMGKVEATEAMNYGIQTLGASIMNRGMKRCYETVIPRYRQAWGIAQIHDAAVFEVWEDDAERFAKDLKPAFEQSYERDGRSIFFNIDVKIADSWDKV